MSKSAASRRRLGRGLDSLIGRSPEAESSETQSPWRVVSINRVHTTRQPRKEFDEASLRELADSIRASGILQPLVVRSDDKETLTLIAGERRLRAARMAGLDSVPVVIRDVDEREAFALALVENVQRQDLGPVEEAEAFRYLIEEQGYTQAQLATKVGFSRSAVANSVRLLRLPGPVQQMIAEGDLSAGHGRAILALDDPELHGPMAERILTEQLTVRQAEDLAREIAQDEERRSNAAEEEPTEQEKKPSDTKALRAQLKEVAGKLREHLRARVLIRQKLDGRGSLEVHFSSDEELKHIVERIFEGDGLG